MDKIEMRDHEASDAQRTSVARRQAINTAKPGASPPAASNPAQAGGGQRSRETQPLIAPDNTGAATDRAKPNWPSQHQSQPAKTTAKPIADTQAGTDSGGATSSAHPESRPLRRSPSANTKASTKFATQTGEISEANGAAKPNAKHPRNCEPEVQLGPETHLICDLRFADPFVQEIVETWRLRQDMVRAQQKLTLQIKAICRRFCAGDKGEAEKLYAAIAGDKPHPLAVPASFACAPLFEARIPLERQRAALEKTLTKLGRGLPITHLCESIKGVSTLTLATIVGECGDLSAYEKGVSGVWKRAGLAVINGERQRKKANADEALLHGYAPSRRSVFWNISVALMRAQGKDETAGPYRQIYDARKAYEIETNELGDGHAHNRAQRHMLKALLKDLTAEWRRVAGLEDLAVAAE